jgi:hypothetical protein
MGKNQLEYTFIARLNNTCIPEQQVCIPESGKLNSASKNAKVLAGKT